MSKDSPIKILGLAGSLRRQSFNKALLAAACELSPAGLSIEVFDIAPIPLFNDDIYQQGFPAPVDELRARIATAEGVLIATPEYNHSFPGVLKNAIDWVSRPPEQPFAGKPVALMGASPSWQGSARAQYHLRQPFVFLDARVLNQPELMVSGVRELVDDKGRLTDEATRERLRAFLEAFARFTRQVKAGAAAG